MLSAVVAEVNKNAEAQLLKPDAPEFQVAGDDQDLGVAVFLSRDQILRRQTIVPEPQVGDAEE